MRWKRWRWRRCVHCWPAPWKPPLFSRPIGWVRNVPVPDVGECVPFSVTHDPSSCGPAAVSITTSRKPIARRAAGIFFPQRPILKLNTHGYSPSVLNKIVQAAGQVKSHRVAAAVLGVVGEISISGRHVNRLTEEIGTELQEKRDRETEDYVHHRRAEPVTSAPSLVAVAMDGGRVMTRESGQGPGVHGEAWKEDKVACLLTLKAETFAEDPHAEPPRCFLDAPAVDNLVREMQSHHGRREENELPQLAELSLGKEQPPAASAASPLTEDTVSGERAWPPKRTKNARTCVATMQDCDGFGKMVAAEAHRRNFQAAPRGALLGDGSAWIWRQQEKWFRHLTPVVDFVHALTYLYVTATTLAASVTERWQLYAAWMTLCWQGKVRQVIEDLETRSECLGSFEGQLPPTDPREALRRTLTYLKNNESRMNYSEYRKQGLPVSSSMVESLIKEVNYRVKGTEKFWDNPEGAEAILQVRAAQLCDDDRLSEYIASRPGTPFRQYKTREYAQAA
jgi:hypothetical protein